MLNFTNMSRIAARDSMWTITHFHPFCYVVIYFEATFVFVEWKKRPCNKRGYLKKSVSFGKVTPCYITGHVFVKTFRITITFKSC